MLLEEMIRDEREKGLREGQRITTAANVITLLELLGEPSDELKKRIEAQQDNEKLSQWLCLAARVKSLEEFTNGM